MHRMISRLIKLHARMTFERYCALLKLIIAILAFFVHATAMNKPSPRMTPTNDIDRGSYRVADRPWTDDRGNRFEIGCALHASSRLGRDNHLMPYSIVGPATSIGDANRLEPFAVVGSKPQTRRDGDAGLILGDHNVVHSHATISRGTRGMTRIGSDCLFMAASHVGHDCSIGNGVTMGNNATLAGHVSVDDAAIIGAFATVIQHSYVGTLAHVLPQLACRKSLVPAETYAGPSSSRVNSIGLRRAGGTIDDVRAVRFKLRYPQLPLPVDLKMADFMEVAMNKWNARMAFGGG